MEQNRGYLKLWHIVALSVVMFGVGVGISISRIAEAIAPPPPPLDQQGKLRDQTKDAVDPASVNVGANTPQNPPGSKDKPTPTFSAIDTPIITTNKGPFQISDDLVIHGLLDVRQGFLSGPAGNGVPLTIFDNVEVRDSGGEKGTINVTGNLEAKGDVVLEGKIDNPSGTIILDGAAKVVEGLEAAAVAVTRGNFEVKNGTSTLNGPVIIGGIVSNPQNVIEIDSNVDISANLDTYSTKVHGDLQVDDSATVIDNLSVTSGDFQVVIGTTTLNKLKVSGGATVNNGLTVKDGATIDTLHINGAAAEILMVDSGTRFKGTVVIEGTTDFINSVNLMAAAPLTVNSPSTFNGNVTVNANIKANAIGSYYRLDKSGVSVSSGVGRVNISLKCGTGDIMTSCQGHAGISNDPKMQYIGSYFNNSVGDSCYATYLNNTGADKDTWTQSICFNPDASAIQNQDGAITQY